MKKKILIISTVQMTRNGISSAIMQIVKAIDQKYECDVLCNGHIDDGIYDEISPYIKNIFVAKRNRNILKYYFTLKRIIKKNKYDIVHIHGNSATMYIEERAVRRKAFIISHCHNTKCQHPIINAILSKAFNANYDIALACSNEAGEWLFTKKYIVLPNTIETSKYRYSEDVGDKIRTELGLKDKMVIGHIGLYNDQKNHEKLFNIFREIKKKEDKAILLCIVGDSEIPMNMRDTIKAKSLQDDVIILNNIPNVYEYVQAMDYFVFPSIYEGFGMVLLEAQAAGVQCYVSDVVPKEVNVTKTIKYIPLEEDDATWSNIILGGNCRNDKEKMYEAVRKSIYDFHTLRSKILEIYK